MGELQVKVENQLGSIEFNFDELKENLTQMMALYKDATFTEESSTIAKKEAAALKNIKKALSDRRIEIKKEYMKPYDDFESKVKELTALIDEPIALIDKQVKAFDEKKKAKKKEKIQELHKSLVGEMEEYLPLDKIYDTKWENVSTTMKSIQDELEQFISSTEMAVATIKEMNSDAVESALERYKSDLSLSNAITYINKHEQMKAEILAREEQKRRKEEERQRLAEIERVKAEERKRVDEEEKAEREKLAEIERAREEERFATERRLMGVKKSGLAETVNADPAEEDLEAPFGEEEPFEVNNSIKAVFTVSGTYEELEQVEMYLNSIGVDWERTDD